MQRERSPQPLLNPPLEMVHGRPSMNQFILDYGLFLAKTVTLVVALALVFSSLARTVAWLRHQEQWRLKVSPLNDRFLRLTRTLQSETLSNKEWKQLLKRDREEEKLRAKTGATRDRIFVLNFEGDMQASATRLLREEITAILSVATPRDKVFLRLESSGGLVHSYGLAASQLTRLRAANLELTVSVDAVAASGGYMMACVGQRIIAAPFAILGSIGVVAQLPNLNRLLKKHDIDIELHTAGEYKRTLTMLGENTEKGREKFREELQETHELFKGFIHQQRPNLNLTTVATGEHWYGIKALELGLCDELMTSDEWLAARAQSADLFLVKYVPGRRLGERVGGFVSKVMSEWQGTLLDRALSRRAY